MKVPGFDGVEVTPVAVKDGTEMHAVLKIYAVSKVRGEHVSDFDAAATGACESALRRAGLAAAARFGAPIEPFLALGMQFAMRNGDVVGRLCCIHRTEGWVEFQSSSGDERMEIPALAQQLRDGTMVLI